MRYGAGFGGHTNGNGVYRTAIDRRQGDNCDLAPRQPFSVVDSCRVARLSEVLRLGVYFDVTRARGLWEEYGLFLILLAAVAGISAGFKYYAERRNRLVFLIADDQQSFWHHALQADGTVMTQFTLRFHVTNMSDGLFHLSKVRFRARTHKLSAMSASLR